MPTTIDGYEISFSRRKYPGTTYTWAFIVLRNPGAANYWEREEHVDVGDPWPAVHWPRKELRRFVGIRLEALRAAGRIPALATSAVAG